MQDWRRALRHVTIAVALITSSACGGGFSTPDGPVVGSPGGGGPPPTKLVNVKVIVTVPSPPKHGLRHDYISYNTQSLSIELTSVGGKGVTGVNPTVMNTLPKSHDCKPQAGGIVCSATAEGSPGDDAFGVATYSQSDANGSVLSVGTVNAKISGSDGNVGISNKVPLTLEGVIASLKVSVTPNKAKRGQNVTATVALDAYDATGAEIEGPSYYDDPITLTIEGDTYNAFRLHYGTHSGDTLVVRKPATGITLTYDGNREASPITLQATVGGSSGIAKSANFNLTGRRPPPPIGTIYVLNLGSNDGISATVTEYSGKAKGNAAPESTLTLSSKLYARSIAVDASGDLYVGYFDNEYGFSPESGEPDAGNEIAIYAPGASGGDQPTAVIAEDKKTSTTVFPIYMAFDAKNRLVTYGATTVDKNTGDAVLTYAPDASGTPAPDYGWDFDTPYLRYSGPTGLALDSDGNFYVNGALHANTGSQDGMYENSAANIGNPSATAIRVIPWNAATSGLAPGLTTNIAVAKSGEIYIANATSSGSGSSSECQANVNVYAAGTNGGVKPLRIMTFSGMTAKDCSNSHGPFLEFYPTIALYGTSVFIVDDYSDVVGAFSANAHGTVKPTLQISGSATQLDAPIAVVVTSTK
jgi:hypothetical protein